MFYYSPISKYIDFIFPLISYLLKNPRLIFYYSSISKYTDSILSSTSYIFPIIFRFIFRGFIFFLIPYFFLKNPRLIFYYSFISKCPDFIFFSISIILCFMFRSFIFPLISYYLFKIEKMSSNNRSFDIWVVRNLRTYIIIRFKYRK